MSDLTRRRPSIRGALAASLLAAAVIGAPVTLAVQKSEAEVQNEFGVKVAQLGSWNEAAFRFERALKAPNGRNATIYNNLAVARESLGQLQAAREAYEAALAITPDDKRIRSNYDRFMAHYKTVEKAGDAP